MQKLQCLCQLHAHNLHTYAYTYIHTGAEGGTVGGGTRITGAVLVGMEWTSAGNFNYQNSQSPIVNFNSVLLCSITLFEEC
jgi:hypothetical protein